NDERIAQQSQERTSVRQRIESVRSTCGNRLRVPGLQQRSGARQKKIGETDARNQQQKHASFGAAVGSQVPGDMQQEAEKNQTSNEQNGVNPTLEVGRNGSG